MDDMLEQLHRRMDTQDTILHEIHDKLVAHIAVEDEIRPALDELVALWKGSKVITRILTGAAAIGAMFWAIFVWAKEHFK